MKCAFLVKFLVRLAVEEPTGRQKYNFAEFQAKKHVEVFFYYKKNLKRQVPVIFLCVLMYILPSLETTITNSLGTAVPRFKITF